MPSNTQPLTDEELEEFKSGRDLGEDLLESIRQMNAGLGSGCTRRSSLPGNAPGCRRRGLPP